MLQFKTALTGYGPLGITGKMYCEGIGKLPADLRKIVDAVQKRVNERFGVDLGNNDLSTAFYDAATKLGIFDSKRLPP